MKIVDRKTFLAMPAGTVFYKYEPHFFTDLGIKGETCGNDFSCFEFGGGIWPDGCNDSGELFAKWEAMLHGEPSGPLDFESEGRDGLFDEDQLFAVWDREDVAGLIARLQEAITPPLPESADSGRG